VEIERLLAEAKSGTGQLLAISGEAGIGKSRLAKVAADRAEDKGFAVFWGRCHEKQYVPPYWPWKQIMRGLLELPQKAKDRHRYDAFAAALGFVIPEIRRRPGGHENFPALSPEQERIHVLDGATGLVKTVSERKPLLLILDNLHCADELSLQLLEVLAREVTEWKVVIAVVYREPNLSGTGPFLETLSALAGEGPFHSITLNGWEKSVVRDYLRAYMKAEPATELVQAIHQRTDGNPLFVAEVIRLLDLEGMIGPAFSGREPEWEIHIPEKVRLAILGQVQKLTPPCRGCLSVAALSGREFDKALLEELEAVEPGRLEEVLEEAIVSGLIEGVGGYGGRYRFIHSLIQEVVEEQVPAPRRAPLHRRIGNALERRYEGSLDAHAGELGRHFESAGREGTVKALHYWQMAGESSLRTCAFEDAYEQFSKALALSKDWAPGQEQAGLLFGLAQSQHGLGDNKSAVENLASAFKLYVSSGDLTRAFQVVEHPYLPAEMRGLGVTRLLETAMALAGPDSALAERLGTHYGLSMYHDTGNYDAAVGIFRRALESARKTGDRGRERMCLANWAHVEDDELHFLSSHQMGEQAISMAAEQHDHLVEAAARYSHWTALLGLGRLAEAKGEARAILHLGERLHSPYLRCAGLYAFANVARQEGDFSGSQESSSKALASRHSSFSISNMIVRSFISFETGNREEGLDYLHRIMEARSRAAETFHWAGWLAVNIPYASWITGYELPLEAAEADARKVAASKGMLRRDAANANAGFAIIAVLRNDSTAAERLYGELEPFRGLVAWPQHSLWADHLLGALARSAGHPLLAREHFEAAIALSRTAGMRVELAYTCCDFADLCSGDGPGRDEERAAALWKESWAIAEGVGMAALVERLKKMQERMKTAGPGPAAFPDSLSKREVDVLRLLAEGLSNDQIGASLFISPYTVANHVQRILEKTGAANRTEAAVYAVRRGLTVPPASAQ
jgi:DNA-binding CsgD family transcriptional regulator